MSTILCDGKSCGEGIHTSGGRYVCPHNNLWVLRNDLMNEWHWEENTKLGLNPKLLGVSSNKKAFWKCVKNPCGCHVWSASIANRTKFDRPTGCPFCKKSKICPHNIASIKHPELLELWHSKNIKSLSEYSPGSKFRAFWKCDKEHEWEATICSVSNGNRCPYCFGKGNKFAPERSFAVVRPDLIKYWSEKNSKPPTEYLSHSGRKIWLRCNKNHEWESSINNVSKGWWCPYCSGTSGKVAPEKSLAIVRPDLIKYWSEKNYKPPTEYLPYSNCKVWWKCDNPECDNPEWEAVVDSVNRGSQCPHCSRICGYSRVQIEWLDSIMKEENIQIQYARSPEGEFGIYGINGTNRLGKVDGYCRETNTVYEYHGDYWHGNPLIYDPNDINKTNHKTFGELYQKTIERDNRIREMGYILVVKWETEEDKSLNVQIRKIDVPSTIYPSVFTGKKKIVIRIHSK